MNDQFFIKHAHSYPWLLDLAGCQRVTWKPSVTWKTYTHINAHTPSQAPPPSDWWHQGRSLSSIHWSGWKWFSRSGHPSGPKESEAERQRLSEQTFNRQHQSTSPLSNKFLMTVFEGKQSKNKNTHTLSISPSFTHCFLFVQSSLASRCLHTLWGCICNSGKAITQSLQIFRGVIGYNVAWKWLRAGKAFSQVQQIFTVLLQLEARDFRAYL